MPGLASAYAAHVVPEILHRRGEDGLPAAGASCDVAPVCPDRLRHRLAAVPLWGAGLAWLSTLMGAQMVLRGRISPAQMRRLERLYTRGQVALTGARWRAEVDPGVDPSRPYVFFQNHVNHLDHCTMYCATPHFKQGVELESHFRYPVYGAFMRGRGTIPVAPGKQALRSLMDGMGNALRSGQSVLVFPEGTRTQTGWLGEFQAGVFRIAQRLEAEIVPVTVTGMYRVMRKGSYLIRPGYDVTVFCDAPIPTAGTTRADLSGLMDQVRQVMLGHLRDYYATVPVDARWWSASLRRD